MKCELTPIPADRQEAANKWDVRFLALALHVREWSKDPSTKHATVLVRPDRTVASLGYNGFARGSPAEEADFAAPQDREERYSRVIHGEMNAILNARTDVRGCTAYVASGVGCDRCTVHLIQAGISRFVFVNGTPDYWSRWGDMALRSLNYIREHWLPALIVTMPEGIVYHRNAAENDRRLGEVHP